MKNETKLRYWEHAGYLIALDRYHWGYEGVAIPDQGETLRRKFIGYTKVEMLASMRGLIQEHSASS